MFFYLIPIFIILFIVFYIAKNKIHIKFKTFFMKGFKKLDNKFGLVVFTGKQGTGKTYSAVNFCVEQNYFNNYLILTNIKSFSNSFPNTTEYYFDIMEIISRAKELHEKQIPFMIFFDEIFTVLERGRFFIY